MINEQTMQLADLLRSAEMLRQGIAPLTSVVPDLSSEAAYRVQLLNIQRKLDAGATVVGKKIGLTSLAMQQSLGVDQPDYGHLLDSMEAPDGGTIAWSRVMQPRVEAEIAFVLKRDLIGPNVTPADVLAATDYVVPSLEIVDSRIADWKIRLSDTIADNASSGIFVLGGHKLPPDALDLTKVSMELFNNDVNVGEGTGAAVMGDPALCVAWLANKLHAFGISLRAGEAILSGALSAAIPAKPGDTFQAIFSSLGQVSVKFA